MAEAVSAPSEALLARGRALTEKLHAVEAEIRGWSDELPASKNETLDAQMHADQALIALDHARNAIAVFAQIVAGMG